MGAEQLQELNTRLNTLTVFRGLWLDDPVMQALRACLNYVGAANQRNAAFAYAEFVSRLYATGHACLARHIRSLVDEDENVFMKAIGRGETPPPSMRAAVELDLRTLQAAADLTPEDLLAVIGTACPLPGFECERVDLTESYRERVSNIGRYGYGIYARHHMFFLNSDGHIVPVQHPDGTRLAQLVDYQREQALILENTRALLAGKPAANILLTGDAGTGKSSTIKAVVNELYQEGLRILEVRREQLHDIPALLDELARNPLKFILFIDDLSFQKDDDNFSALKAVLEGSVSTKSANVVIYATSNRRHLVKETFSDREGDDVHRNDTMQEIISLSERFGLHITFQKPTKATYLHIVRTLAEDAGIRRSPEELDALAERFALGRGGRSPRAARQFVDSLVATE